jgi:hypothetical protein
LLGWSLDRPQDRKAGGGDPVAQRAALFVIAFIDCLRQVDAMIREIDTVITAGRTGIQQATFTR